MTDLPTTEDRWLGGRLMLRQPAQGYRIAIDAALLAASVPLAPGGRALELGTGVGAGALALAARVAGASVEGVELQSSLAELARANVERNGAADRVLIREADVRDLPAADFDEVFFNPPYLKPGENDASPDPRRRIATVEVEGALDDWMLAAARAARPGGGITLIHRADRLPDVLAAAARAGVGGLAAFPLWPKAGAAARRVIVRGRAGRQGPFRLAPGMVLHGPDGGYAPDAAAVLADLRPIEI